MSQSDNGNGPRIAGTIAGDMQPCWLCGRSVSARALFCHGCGAVLPPRELDHFARLNLECRFDIDLEQLGRQHTGLTKALDPERFVARGARQQAHARAQAEAMTAAYEVLRDPVRRARYLLEMLGIERVAASPADDPDAMDLRGDLAAAPDAAAVDRVALDVVHRIEACIRDLSIAFRTGLTGNAARVLARLEDLDAIAEAARERRAAFTDKTP
ncbi:molecular chaperone DnaJ [Azospirillum sp. TSO22-1]|uniref:molecular chaperone DnaJ n=1 Tax=Azospirillum sp. TSO22-1 TaxID=716789 RepID=UPI000D62024E|nr:molecular chaperone DnaJ [Azospirillum sp. TSO22-1]PWC54625.1 molecular chaperone DnaJ [Azospirillum sp. TSO22-1]